MVDLDHMHVYTWDARPYPAFPDNLDVWGDGDNWRLGHWLNGRFAAAPLAETVARLLDDYGFADHETGALNGTVPGYVIDRVMSARDALQPLGARLLLRLRRERRRASRSAIAAPSRRRLTLSDGRSRREPRRATRC